MNLLNYKLIYLSLTIFFQIDAMATNIESPKLEGKINYLLLLNYFNILNVVHSKPAYLILITNCYFI